MSKHKNLILAPLIFAMILSAGAKGAPTQSGEEAAGQAAEQAGKLREAITHYTAALQSAPEGGDQDQRLREKIIKLVLQLNLAPAVPDEAHRHLVRGRAAVSAANDKEGFLRAANEFKEALKIAPWIGEAYFNLGLLQDKGGDYSNAIRNLKLYLLAAPNADDAQKVKDQLIEIEYRQEEAKRTSVEAQRKAAEAQEQQRQKLLQSLQGEWRDTMYDTNPCIGSDHFELSFSAPDRFTLRYLRRVYPTSCTGPDWISLVSRTFEGTLNGKKASITYTMVNDYNSSGFPSCRRRGRATDVYYGEGTFSDDGERLQVTIRGWGWDESTCRDAGSEELLVPLVKVR